MVAVVMPVYQGEAFLAPQVESILGQSYSDIRLYIRDDGSRDNSLKIIRDYARKDVRVVLVSDNMGQLGVTGSIKALLAKVQEDVVFFADQDDVWASNKVKTLLMHMPDNGLGPTPAVVFSDLEVVDESLNLIFESFWSISGIKPCSLSFRKIIRRNCVTGCAAAINKSMFELIRSMPDEAVHDWWIGCLAAHSGQLISVDEKLVKYRQHGSNAIGAQVKGLQRIKTLIGNSDYKDICRRQLNNSIDHLKAISEDSHFDTGLISGIALQGEIFRRILALNLLKVL